MRSSLTRGDVHDRTHIGRQAEHVHRNNGAGLFRNGVCYQIRVDVVAVCVDVDEHGLRINVLNSLERRGEREWARDDLIAGTDTESYNHDMQGVCSGADGHSVTDAKVVGDGVLERSHVRTQYIRAAPRDLQ